MMLLSLSWMVSSQEPKNNMTFFITSVGSGKGADLGGLAGADKHCQALAQTVGAGNHTWHAYLSTSPADGKPAVNARDRIGKGPWQNAKGVVIAKDVYDLHSNNNKINKETGLSEKGETINASGDKPNMHDILTGSQPDGRAFTGAEDRTCRNWTSSTTGVAMLGHHNRQGLRDDESSRSWNSSHPSRDAGASSGCSQEGLRSSGGNGLFYCFAVNQVGR
ncbi:MAG TPA: lectin [Candidatus Binatia bacterium]